MPPKWEAANKLMGPSLMQYRPMPRTQIDPALSNAGLQAITTELVKCIVDFLLANRRENEAGSVSVRIGGVETVKMIPKPEAKVEVAVQTRKPKIGDIVLYCLPLYEGLADKSKLPAIVQKVNPDETLNLSVCWDNGWKIHNNIKAGNSPNRQLWVAGRWFWPE
jgi:hypothetical protein